MAITLTERAVCELKTLMTDANQAGAALRVWVAGGGCSGLNYQMAIDDQAPDAADHVEEQDGIRIFVDEFSLQYITGSVVDYIDDPMGGGFKVENPNAVASCGCGSSFSTEEGGGSGGGCGGCGMRG